MPINLKDLADVVLAEAAERLADRMDRIDRVKRMAKERIKVDLVDTGERAEKFERRLARAAEHGFERKIGASNDILSIEFLEGGVEAGKAVGRIEVGGGLEFGTGFFVCPSLIMTNHHVIPDTAKAVASTIEMFAESNRVGERRHEETFYLDPDKFFLTNAELDFTVLGVEESNPTDDYGWLPLLEEQGKILIGHSVNIIQHPGGKDKMVVTQNSRLLDLEDAPGVENYCWYEADTEEGSSGSPVFNNQWEIVALHHKAVPKKNVHGDILDVHGKTMDEERFKTQPELVHWVANEGIRCSKIVNAIRDERIENEEQGKLRDKLLSLWAHPKARRPGLKKGWY